MSDTRRLLLTVLLAAWALSFGYAFVYLVTAEPSGDGFTRGLNRITGYLGWQGIAGVLGVAIFGVGRGWPKGSSVRWLTSVPLGLALIHVAAIVGFVAWGNFIA